MITSGIYTITNMINGKVYVGSTIDFEGRWGSHRSDLCKGIHCNPYLQRSWNKYGKNAFEFMICEYVNNVGQLIDREQYWLDWHRLQAEVYNIALVVGRPPSRLGCETTDETKQKLRKASLGNQNALGYKHPQETRDRMSKGQRNMSLEAKAEKSRKIREARMGKPSGMLGHKHTVETRRRMSKAKMGHPVSKETRRRIGDANRGRKLPPMSEEARCNISKATMGHTVSKETRQKIGDANRGRKLGPQSEEQKQKTSKALKAYWARVREQNII